LELKELYMPRGWKTTYSVASWDYSDKKRAIKKAKEYANDQGSPQDLIIRMDKIASGPFGKQIWKERTVSIKPDKQKNPAINISKSDWIPVHAIRKTASGDIEVLTEKGTTSNPGKRKKFLAKIKKLFT